MPSHKDREHTEFFGPFQVHEHLGFGGMATVHRATKICEDGSTQVVALKRILPHLADDERFVANFAREARLAMLLDHPNIVSVYELGQVGNEHFIAMEYIDGLNLRQILRKASQKQVRPSPQVALSIILLLSRALEYAHTRCDATGAPLGLIHRDVSPANVLVSRTGALKIIDFGIARVSLNQGHTENNTFKGKLGYMSPESLKCAAVDARADIWSLGVLAHELITARSLFDRKNEFATIQRVRELEIPNPSETNSECPIELAAIILRALEREADLRWQSAAEMRAALEELATSLGMSISEEAIAHWSSEVSGDPPPEIEEEEPATLINIRPPTLPRPAAARLPLMPAPATMRLPSQRSAALLASAPSETLPGACGPGVSSDDSSVGPRISFRPPTVGGTEVLDQVQPVLEPPPGLSYLLTKTAGAAETERSSRTPPNWPLGTVAPPFEGERMSDFVPTPLPEGELEDPLLSMRAPQLWRPTAHKRPRCVVPEAQTQPARSRRRWYYLLFILAITGASFLATALLSKWGTWGASEDEGTALHIAAKSSTIVISAIPRGATTYVDGSPRETPLELAPGTYQLEVAYPGHQSFREELVVAAGEDQQFRVALRPLETSADTAEARTLANEPAPTQAFAPTVSVSAGEMTQTRGKALVLSEAETRKHVRALLCVDPSGTVSSAEVLSRVTQADKRRLESQLQSWRYQPFLQEGQPVVACFVARPKLASLAPASQPAARAADSTDADSTDADSTDTDSTH